MLYVVEVEREKGPEEGMCIVPCASTTTYVVQHSGWRKETRGRLTI